MAQQGLPLELSLRAPTHNSLLHSRTWLRRLETKCLPLIMGQLHRTITWYQLQETLPDATRLKLQNPCFLPTDTCTERVEALAAKVLSKAMLLIMLPGSPGLYLWLYRM